MMKIIVNWVLSHPLYMLLIAATAFGYIWISLNKKKLRINEITALLLAVSHTVIGLLSVKLFAFLESGEAGGQSLYGGIFFMPLIYYLGAKIFKRSIADVFDIFAIDMIFTMLCARVNCLISKCCLGLPVPGTDGFCWPTREAELVFYAVLLIWLGTKVGKAKFNGMIYPLYMLSYGTFRFIIEWFRESENFIGIFHISHIWSLVSIAVGGFIYYKLKQKNGSKAGKKSNPKKRKGRK